MVKATLAGGLLFLLPIILVVIVIGHAVKLMAAIAEPVAHLLPAGSIVGLHSENILAILLLVLISLFAGLVARTRPGRRVMRWSETSLLGGMPQYQLVKSVAQGMAQVENMEGVKVALVSIDGGWQIGYLLETLPNGWTTIFVPQAPTPMSGNVMYLPADRVQPLTMSMAQAMTLVKRLGRIDIHLSQIMAPAR
ncbi:DUF502 domain-containing protein [Ancylobacter defluvii]|uniref:DUF502 domain-containing protein n=1 Tax=Ancylobacter defluvii TaxID=1282440 RepID=A0A9W6K3L1_9HYPH|nr:DUF502 domain-containing protein [Ancylobacter defluvii]MBS7588886.1 DUF502 domain-containing protein [Ancylobacter defluvii]GLK86348.1 hypothetical protein GCM10017653_44180 [Ancylobacter defluvii]